MNFELETVNELERQLAVLRKAAEKLLKTARLEFREEDGSHFVSDARVDVDDLLALSRALREEQEKVA